MKLPKKIKLGPYSFTVTSIKELWKNEDSWGYVRFALQALGIDDSLKGTQQAQTLFHEIQHIVNAHTGGKRVDEDEDLVDRMGSAWLEVLIRTPRLLEYLLEIRDSQ